ncbi:MAG: hypothetical protein ACKVS8_10345 [Phycisphaerales bacterium]
MFFDTKLFVAAVAGAVVGVASCGVAAQSVFSYDLFKSAVYSQTSNDAPPAPDYFIGVARIILNVAEDVTPVNLQYNGVYDGAGLLSFDETQYLFFSTPRATIAALDADFPVGTYTYRIFGSFPWQQSATLQLPATQLAAAVPAFTGDTWERMTAGAANAGQAFTGTINGWVPGVGGQADEWFTFVNVHDANTGEFVFSAGVLDPTAQEFTIDAGVLAPSTLYQVSVYYSTRDNQSPGGFGGALRLAGFDRVVVAFLLTAAPSCVLDYNLDTVINPDDLGDFITDYYTDPAIPGPGGYAIACPENDPPYDAGYKTGYTPDGSGQCNEPFPDNLGDFITDYYASEGC